MFSTVDSVPSFIGNLYGSNIYTERPGFFTLLNEKISTIQCYCLLGGDVNCILNIGERSASNEGAYFDLRSFVQGNNLLDLPLSGSKFTWYSLRYGGIWSRLDRWIVNEEAINHFEGLCQTTENWGLSDHRPVALTMGAVNYGPKPFRFYNNWLLDKEFESLVKDWWASSTVQGWSGFSLH